MSFIFAPAASPFTAVATWADLPAAASATPGALYRVAGVGVGGYSFWFSDGTFWRPQNGMVTLYNGVGPNTGSYSVPVTSLTAVTGSTQVFVLPVDMLIPAGMMRHGSALRFSYSGRRNASGTDNLKFCLAASPTVYVASEEITTQILSSPATGSIQGTQWWMFADDGSGFLRCAGRPVPWLVELSGIDRNVSFTPGSAFYFLIAWNRTSGADVLERIHNYQLDFIG